jgi:hypothetical protein
MMEITRGPISGKRTESNPGGGLANRRPVFGDIPNVRLQKWVDGRFVYEWLCDNGIAPYLFAYWMTRKEIEYQNILKTYLIAENYQTYTETLFRNVDLNEAPLAMAQLYQELYSDIEKEINKSQKKTSRLKFSTSRKRRKKPAVPEYTICRHRLETFHCYQGCNSDLTQISKMDLNQLSLGEKLSIFCGYYSSLPALVWLRKFLHIRSSLSKKELEALKERVIEHGLLANLRPQKRSTDLNSGKIRRMKMLAGYEEPDEDKNERATAPDEIMRLAICARELGILSDVHGWICRDIIG